MNIGNKEIIAAYIGDTQVDRIYLGDTLVYGEGGEVTNPLVSFAIHEPATYKITGDINQFSLGTGSVSTPSSNYLALQPMWNTDNIPVVSRVELDVTSPINVIFPYINSGFGDNLVTSSVQEGDVWHVTFSWVQNATWYRVQCNPMNSTYSNLRVYDEGGNIINM